ncbi:cutinase family protein [Nocardia sp. NPDC051030]|uniref:cutinase family protein n=1 Tax=Nocardia sp. NPDC051030 TaxID=3155162 RepID=UPI00343314C9
MTLRPDLRDRRPRAHGRSLALGVGALARAPIADHRAPITPLGPIAGRARRAPAAALMVCMVVIGLVVTLTGSSVAQPGGGSQAQSPGCPLFEMVLIPGTGETHANADPNSWDNTMLAPLASGLKQKFSQLSVYNTPYKASAFTNDASYAASKRTGVTAAKAELKRLATDCPSTKVGIAGYSQGADVGGDVACEIGNGTGPIPATSVVGVALIADPHQGTKGATAIGATNNAAGILGARDCTYGSLSDRVTTFCQSSGDNPDLYCAADKNSDPILAGIASVVSSTASGDDSSGDGSGGGGASPSSDKATTTSKSEQLTQQLTSDFSNADVAGLATTVSTLAQQAASGDTTGAARTAGTLLDTLTPLADIVDTATGNQGIAQTLKSAAEGSNDNIAGQVLDTLSKVDLDKAITTVQKIANTALGTSGDGARDPSTTKGDTTSLADAATSLTSQLAPVTNTASSQLATAADVLSVVKPRVILDQIVNVATGTLSTAVNLPKILDAFGRIIGVLTDGNLDLWGKADALHTICDELNVLFQPIVKMAAGVDLTTASTLIGMIPDTTGTAEVASLIVSLLAKVDIIRVANRVGDLQTTAWKFLDSCKTGCNLLIATDLIPIALDFATIAVNALTGTSKTSSDQLGKADDVTKQLATSTYSVESVAKNLVSSAGGSGASSLSTLISEGLKAASFYTSGAHQSYANLVVDKSGRTTFEYLIDWFSGQFQKTLT